MSQLDPMSPEVKQLHIERLAAALNLSRTTAQMFLENNRYNYDRAKAEAEAAKKEAK